MSPISQEQAGQAIQAARIAVGQTQAAVAERTGFGQGRISEWERGVRAITLRDAGAIAEALGLTMIYDGRRLALVDPATVELPKEG